MLIGYVGTYTTDGVYEFHFDRGSRKFQKVNQLAKIHESKWIGFHEHFLYTTMKEDDIAGVAKIDVQGNIVAKALSEKVTPCHFAMNDSYLISVNFHEGSVCRYDHQLQLQKRVVIDTQAGAHQVVIVDELIYVPCLKLDQIVVLTMELEIIERIMLDIKSGPRHLVVTKNHQEMFVVCEKSNEVIRLQKEDKWRKVECLKITSDKANSIDSAAIQLSHDERFIFVSVRGEDLIYSIEIQSRMQIIQHIHSYGEHPRCALLSNESDYIFIANKDSHRCSAFAIKDGDLEFCDQLYIENVVSIAWKGA